MMDENDYINELFDRYDSSELLELMYIKGLLDDEKFKDMFWHELKKIHLEEDDGR